MPLVSLLSLGAVRWSFVTWSVLSGKFLDPLRLQGASRNFLVLRIKAASRNFLVLRIKAHKTIRVSHAFWGPASSGKEGLRKGLLPVVDHLTIHPHTPNQEPGGLSRSDPK